MRNWIGRVSLTFVIAAVVILVMLWNNYEGKKSELAKQARQTIRQQIDETDRLASLGDINIDLSGLTLAKLNEVLRQPPHKLESRGKSTRLGWACGGELCALYAAFLVPAGDDVPLSTAPFQITVNKIGFGKPFSGSIAGVHLGDSPDTILAVCRKNGYGASKGSDRLTLDRDWEVLWGGSHHGAASLMFWNMSVVEKSGAKPEGARN